MQADKGGAMEPDSYRLRTQISLALRNRKKRPDVSAAHGRDGSRVLIASYNVHKCVGTDGRFDPGRIAQVIKEIDPDIIALQEADKRFGERVGLLDLAHLEREVGLSWVGTTGGARSHGWHGNVVLARHSIVRDLHPVRLPGLEPRGALVAELELKSGFRLRVIGAHFGLLRHSRRLQADALSGFVSSRREIPTVLMGDLNEWRLGRGSSLRGLAPLFCDVPAPVASFPSRLPLFALDRIVSDRAGLIGWYGAHDSALSRVASDHLPVKAYVAVV